MRLEFSAALTTVRVGDEVTVSTDAVEPKDPASVAWRIWRSHNFAGVVSAADETAIVVDLPEKDGCALSYALTDAPGVMIEIMTVAGWDADRAARWQQILHGRIDQEAGEARKCYMTAIPDQVEIYRLKEAQAREFLGLPSASLSDYPAIEAEVQATGLDAAEAAAEIIAAADAAEVLRWAIERMRIAAKRAVSNAETLAAMQAAATVNWGAVA